MKIGLIRCLQTENVCPAAKCFQAMREKKGAFAGCGEEIVCVGVNTCGGCPGKNAAQRARHMVRQGAEAIVIASCITLGTPHAFPCPFRRQLTDTVRAAVGEDIPVFDHSHDAPKKRRAKPAPAGDESGADPGN